MAFEIDRGMTMKRLLVLALGAAVAGCATSSPLPPTTMVVRAPDPGVMTFQVAGLSVGMSPSRVRQVAVANGWTEDRYSSQTIEELAITSESGRMQRGVDSRVSFDTKTPHQGSVQAHFCGRRAFFLRAEYQIPDAQYDAEVGRARAELSALGDKPLSEKKEALSHRITYQPQAGGGYVTIDIHKLVAGTPYYRVWRTSYDQNGC